ncbi:hypothetical protein [Flavobacterium sp. LAR06]|uniref:hypothetical protein n=1 Tax=Flavobacterium sp. LAR06 TaxID=3064897 RepID=UPI0035BF8FF6
MSFLVFFGFLILSFAVKAQSVTGIVNDQKGKALSDVLVRNLMSKSHAHTDSSGKFTLDYTKAQDSMRYQKKS